MQRITDKKLPWGGRVLVAELPAGGSVSIVGSIALGSRSTRDDELASMHAQMLLEGTTKFNKRALQDELDRMGATLSFTPTSDRLNFFARVRTVHVSDLLALVAEVLLNPTFPQNELSVLKKGEEAALNLQAQNTNTQAAIALSQLIYPKRHPNYAQSTKDSLATLKKLTSDTLRRYHRTFLNRNTLVVSLAGDIAPDKAVAAVKLTFAQLPDKKIAAQKVVPAMLPKARQAVATIKNKASIDYMAGVAARITDEHKDFAAFIMGLQILGNRSGFTGRLMQTVREQEGLTYGVYSYPVGFASDQDGHALVWATFAPQLFERGRAAVLREVRQIVEDGASDDEVKRHTRMYEAQSRVRRSNSSAIAKAAHDVVIDNKKLSYLHDFPKQVLKLTATQVNQALKKYLRPELLSETAAGPIEKF